MDNMKYWDAMKQPPPEALKTIRGGRISGMTDINPQWRYKTMTKQFGICGIGWKYTIEKLWLEPANDQVCAFAEIWLSIKVDGEWSDPIPGIGGSMLVTKESAGLHVSDEAFKMAITDALSVAMKMIGVAADVYAGLFDGGKYAEEKKAPTKAEQKATPQPTEAKSSPVKQDSRSLPPPLKNLDELLARAAKFGLSPSDVFLAVELEGVDEITDFDEAWKLTAKKFRGTIKAQQEAK